MDFILLPAADRIADRFNICILFVSLHRLYTAEAEGAVCIVIVMRIYNSRIRGVRSAEQSVGVILHCNHLFAVNVTSITGFRETSYKDSIGYSLFSIDTGQEISLHW